MLATARENSTHQTNVRDIGPSPGDELAIIQRAQSNPEAFAPLYELYVDAIFGYCYNRTRDRELAADLTQQIFVRVLASLSRFTDRSGGSFRSWLFSIAHNLIVDTWRTRKDTASLDAGRHEQVRDRDRSPEDHAIASEQRRLLLNALQALTEGQRQVVELRLAGLTGPEIATALDMRLAAVKSTQFRAYAKLRDLLGDTLAIDTSGPAGRTLDHD